MIPKIFKGLLEEIILDQFTRKVILQQFYFIVIFIFSVRLLEAFKKNTVLVSILDVIFLEPGMVFNWID